MAASGRPAEGLTLEAEMSRFEQEIKGPDGLDKSTAAAAAPKFIIGSNTFSQVQQQLSSLRAQVDATRQPPQPPGPPGAAPPGGSVLVPPLRPPPPPSKLLPPMHAPGVERHSFSALPQPLVPPPPPPTAIIQRGAVPQPPVLPQPPRPAGMSAAAAMPLPFMPPQLRHRAPSAPAAAAPLVPPPAPPALPFTATGQGPLGLPPRLPMPPRMPTHFVPAALYGLQKPAVIAGQEQKPSPAAAAVGGVIEKSRVVYSAPPSRLLTKETAVAGFSQPMSAAAAAMAVLAESQRTIPALAAAATVAAVPQAAQPVAASTASADGDAAASAPPAPKKEKKEKKKKIIRTAAGLVWEDTTLTEWDPDDFRIFCGDLGNEVTDEKLADAFRKYPSFQRAKVVRDKRTNKTKGYGFVSFKDPNDYTRAMREMNGKYVGNRPIKLRKSSWKERNIEVVKKKDKEKKRLGFK